MIHGWTKCVELLLKSGAKIAADIENMTLFHYTVSTVSEEIAKAFLDAGVPIDLPVKRKMWRQTRDNVP